MKVILITALILNIFGAATSHILLCQWIDIIAGIISAVSFVTEVTEKE